MVESAPRARAAARSSSHPLIAGAAGNVMEWFDFSVYGYFAAILGREFFPSSDPVASVLSAFTVFASGFLARPFGAAFFGWLGDRHGRRVVMRLSVLLMGACTALVAVLPTYAQAGVAAPILLTLLRLAQGFSVGGEYTGSAIYMVEAAPAERRGIVGGWTNFGSVAGFLLGSAVGAILSSVCTDAELSAWGWRVAFLLGVSVAAVAAFYRSEIDDERPASNAAKEAEVASPLREALRCDGRTMVRIAGIILMANVGFYMMFVYVTTFLSERVGVPMASALEIDTASMSALLVLVPAGGWLSDRIGRKPVLLAASIGAVVLSIPLFLAIQHDDPLLIFAGQIGFAVIVGLSFGANASTIVEITPARTRCTTLSVAYNVTLALFGGTTPLVAAWLISRTGDDLTPAYYVMAMGLVTTLAVLGLKEPRGRPLDA
jgi:MHS family proline/betaine transporter-like MFS transporter